MAIRWQCPDCSQVNEERAIFEVAALLQCDECERFVLREESLCVVCDSRDPLRFRDSVHLWCRTCGTMQLAS